MENHVTYLSRYVMNSDITRLNPLSSTYCPAYVDREYCNYGNVRGQVGVAKHERDLVAEKSKTPAFMVRAEPS